MTIPTKREYPNGLSAADAIAAGFPVGTRAEYRSEAGTWQLELELSPTRPVWRAPSYITVKAASSPLTITSIPEQPALRYSGDLVASECIAAGMPLGTRVRPWKNGHVCELRQDGWYWINRDGTVTDARPHHTLWKSTATGPEPAAEPEREPPKRDAEFEIDRLDNRVDKLALRVTALERSAAPTDSIPVEGLKSRLERAIERGLPRELNDEITEEQIDAIYRALTGRED